MNNESANDPTLDDLQNALRFIEQAERDAVIEAARKDFLVFFPFVMRIEDEPAQVTSVIHEWEKHWRRWVSKFHVGFVAPPGFGKTIFLVAKILRRLGENRDATIALVSVKDEMAKNTMRLVSHYIETSDELHEVYPELRKPRREVVWDMHKIQIDRKRKAGEPSFGIYSMFADQANVHYDWLIYDDPVGPEAMEEASREKGRVRHEIVWKRRLHPGRGRMFMACQHRYADDDVVAEIMSDPQWRVLVQGISEDCTKVEQPPKHVSDMDFAAVKPCQETVTVVELPGFLANQTENYLLQKRHQPIYFGQSMQQKTLSSFDKIFSPAALLALNWNLHIDEVRAQARRDHWPVLISSDFSKAKRAGSVVLAAALNPRTRRKYPLAIEVGKFGAGPDIAFKMIAMHNEWNSQGILIEDAGLQGEFKKWTDSLWPGKIFPFELVDISHSKMHPEIGIPGLAAEMLAGQWCIPLKQVEWMRDGNEDKHDPWGRLVHELKQYPNSTDDVLMALWMWWRVAAGPRGPAKYFPMDGWDSGLQSDVRTRVFARGFGVSGSAPTSGISPMRLPQGDPTKFGFSRRW